MTAPIRLAAAAIGLALLSQTATAQKPFSFAFVVRHDPSVIKLNDVLLSSLLRSKRENMCRAAGLNPAHFHGFELEDAGDQPPGTYAGQLTLQFSQDVSPGGMRKLAQTHMDHLQAVLDELLMGDRRRTTERKLASLVDRREEAKASLRKVGRGGNSEDRAVRLQLQNLQNEMRQIQLQAETEEASLQVLHDKQALLATELHRLEQEREKLRKHMRTLEVMVAEQTANQNRTEKETKVLQMALDDLEVTRVRMVKVVTELESTSAAANAQEERMREHSVQVPVLRERAKVLTRMAKEAEQRLVEAEKIALIEAERASQRAELTDFVRQLSEEIRALESRLVGVQAVRVQPWW